jgi:hypothetical protein
LLCGSVSTWRLWDRGSRPRKVLVHTATRRRPSGIAAVEHTRLLVDIHLRRLLHLTRSMSRLWSSKMRHGRLLIRRRGRVSLCSIRVDVGERCRSTAWLLRTHAWCTRGIRRGNSVVSVSRHTQRTWLCDCLELFESLRNRIQLLLRFWLISLLLVGRCDIEDVVTNVQLEICTRINWFRTSRLSSVLYDFATNWPARWPRWLDVLGRGW